MRRPSGVCVSSLLPLPNLIEQENPLLTVSSSTRYQARGAVAIKLQCNDNTWENPSWTQGQTYASKRVNCQPVNLIIDADDVRTL